MDKDKDHIHICIHRIYDKIDKVGSSVTNLERLMTERVDDKAEKLRKRLVDLETKFVIFRTKVLTIGSCVIGALEALRWYASEAGILP